MLFHRVFNLHALISDPPPDLTFVSIQANASYCINSHGHIHIFTTMHFFHDFFEILKRIYGKCFFDTTCPVVYVICRNLELYTIMLFVSKWFLRTDQELEFFKGKHYINILSLLHIIFYFILILVHERDVSATVVMLL